MSSFFKNGIEQRLSRNKEKYKLLKLKELIDWSTIGELLNKQRQNSRKDARGNAFHDGLKMFKAFLLGQINDQLASRRMKVSKAQTAVVDASIIESRGMPQTKAIEVDEESVDVSETPPSKNVDARWIKKAGRFYLGCTRAAMKKDSSTSSTSRPPTGTKPSILSR